MTAEVEALRDEGTRTQVLIAGAAAGLVSRFCIAPLDVIKIRLQLQPYVSGLDAAASALPRNTIAVFRSILHTEGVRGFWKGNVPAEALYLTYGATQFLSYRSATQALSSLPFAVPPALTSFLSGAMAGMVATTATYPLDLLRTRFAAQGQVRVYSSLLGGIRDIALTEGPRGFFRGLGAGVGQVVPYMGLFFALYETMKPTYAQIVHGSPFLEMLGSGEALAGVTASVFSKTAVFPLDTVRKRLQVQGPMRLRFGVGGIPVYNKGVIGTMRLIAIKEGLRGLYRGLPIGLVKAAPASAVTMWTYERTMDLLREQQLFVSS